MVLYFALVCCARAARALTACGKGERIATRLAAVSPTGSVGASASQRCPPDTRTAMTGKRKYNRSPYVFAITKRLVILSDVASACGAGKSEQKEAPRSKVVRAPSENNFWAPQE